MKAVTIRNELKPGDVGYITYLHGKLHSNEFGFDYTFEAYVGEPLSQFAKRNNPRERLWVVESQNEIVGSIAICEFSEPVTQLRWFLLSPKMRGQGIGKQLMHEALRFSKAMTYSEVHLWTVKGLETARKIYIDQGFSLVKEVTSKTWGAEYTEQKYSVSV